MKTGDRVKLVGIPPDVRDKDDMQTRTLFEKCLGQTFVVAGVESFDGIPTGVVGVIAWLQQPPRQHLNGEYPEMS